MSISFLICLAVLTIVAALGGPIAFAMIVSAILFLAMNSLDLGLAGEQLIQGLYHSFVLLAIPLFIVAANIMNSGTISERLLGFCNAIVGRFRGGLGYVNILASLVFSGMSGSALADAAGIGKIIIDMMRKEGRYSPGYAAAITAASATIGPIIPPSIPMVLYALVSDSSIGYLFLGGVLPGLLMAVALLIMNARAAHVRAFPVESPVEIWALPKITFRALPALFMPVILLYGIYGGVTTPTEAAALAAAYSLLVAAVFYRSLSFRKLYSCFAESARASAAVGLVIGGALIFNYIVGYENLPATIAEMFQQIDLPPVAFLLLVNVIVLLLGCVLDTNTIILVILPLFIPTCTALGIDLVHFGVVMVVNCMIGLITPPFGMLLFVISATTKISLRDIIREIWPFIVVLVASLVVMVCVPAVVLWLPEQLGYVSG